MKLSSWPGQAKRHVVTAGLYLLSNRVHGAFSIYVGKPAPRDHGAPECEFVTRDERSIPVFAHYRYAVKHVWTMFQGLNLLGKLRNLECLEGSVSAYLDRAIGTRTITVPPNEAVEVARKAARRYPALFIPGVLDEVGLPVLLPNESLLRRQIQAFKRQHATILQRLAAAKICDIPSGGSILEIGYISGGHSLFAFEQLGFSTFGIDNFYGGVTGTSSLHEHIGSMVGSNTKFENGDITRQTPFPAESMDVVFSSSVLEHVQDLEKAFLEMYRLLKPGGAIIHNYHPYFCHDGGHALGIGDSPWAHVRLNEQEYLSYLAELRPNEAEQNQVWVKHALHRNMPQWKVQRLIAMAGFDLKLWVAKPSHQRWLKDLTPQIIHECFAATPEIGIGDLVSKSVSFVALKPWP